MLLLHCDGTNGSTSFPDESTYNHTITANGDAQVSTAQKKFGTGSALLDGTGDYLTCPDSAAFDFGNGDFTLEFWTYPISINTSYEGYLCQFNGANYNWQIYRNLTTNFLSASVYHSGGSAWTVTNNTAACGISAWHHVALVRNGTSLTLYVDGTGVTYGSSLGTTAIDNDTVDVSVGGRGDGSFLVNAYIDEVRISDTARWTSDFTPPTSPY